MSAEANEAKVEVLPFDKDKLFAELESHLIKVAKRLHVQDAAGESRSWYAQFSKIYSQMDTDAKHLVRCRFKNGGVVKEVSIAKIKHNVFAYLVKSFKMSLLPRSAHDRNAAETYAAPAKSSDTPTNQNQQQVFDDALDLSKLTLDDLIEIVAVDLRRLESNTKSSTAGINRIFVSCVLEHYKQIRAELGNIPVARNLSAEKPKEFFVEEIWKNRNKEILFRLIEASKLESSRHLTKQLLKLISTSDNYGNFRRKLTRYMTGQHGGLHRRLLKKL